MGDLLLQTAEQGRQVPFLEGGEDAREVEGGFGESIPDGAELLSQHRRIARKDEDVFELRHREEEPVREDELDSFRQGGHREVDLGSLLAEEVLDGLGHPRVEDHGTIEGSRHGGKGEVVVSGTHPSAREDHVETPGKGLHRFSDVVRYIGDDGDPLDPAAQGVEFLHEERGVDVLHLPGEDFVADDDDSVTCGARVHGGYDAALRTFGPEEDGKGRRRVRIFALSDPHFGRDMSRFGDVWVNHEDVIRREWRRTVDPSDLVLIPGDFSWATTTKTIEKHLDAVNGLPGRVIISPGNHDKWWKKTARLRFSEVTFLCDASMPLGQDWVLAGTMGWDCPESPWWEEEDREVFDEACRALEATLERATADFPNRRILLMFHYPPRWERQETPTAFEEILARFPVDLVLYGHIHGGDLAMAHNGVMTVGERRIRYENASADRLKMRPMKLLELPGSAADLSREAE